MCATRHLPSLRLDLRHHPSLPTLIFYSLVGTTMPPSTDLDCIRDVHRLLQRKGHCPPDAVTVLTGPLACSQCRSLGIIRPGFSLISFDHKDQPQTQSAQNAMGEPDDSDVSPDASESLVRSQESSRARSNTLPNDAGSLGSCVVPPPHSYAGIQLSVVLANRDTQGEETEKQVCSCHTLDAVDTTISVKLLEDPVTRQFLSDFASRYPTLRRIVVQTDGQPPPPVGSCASRGDVQPKPVNQFGDEQTRSHLGIPCSADLVRTNL
ncbi:uncharacterized protein EI90DRAFT_3043761 [Cantharellus anzutake]|uniref:uncharacterized protein n=1 Tax=Cantharellus anzutake TaxID=1750568 RepID=UPI001902DF6D|nr:uncharacterized protein EI90DRAFT_3043761 [Cantharellus anzutake]KAF8336824.1 hypothetical protein EI90DRAFT_3043761 [Cantharellus anzutake]